MTDRENGRDRPESIVERGSYQGAEKAIRNQLRLLGIDLEDQDGVNSIRDDFKYLRTIRLASESRKSEIIKSITTTFVGAICTLLFAWAVGWLKLKGISVP